MVAACFLSDRCGFPKRLTLRLTLAYIFLFIFLPYAFPKAALAPGANRARVISLIPRCGLPAACFSAASVLGSWPASFGLAKTIAGLFVRTGSLSV